MMNTAAFASPVLYGPIQYLSFNDSPFQEIDFETFYLEDFEDRLFNVPGVTATNNNPGQTLSVLTHSIYGDSVDGDDGIIDGSGVTGYALADTNNLPSTALFKSVPPPLFDMKMGKKGYILCEISFFIFICLYQIFDYNIRYLKTN
jgi:hypothetical protein